MFDQGWLFFHGDTSDAAPPSFDDGSWRALCLPQDWSIEDLPYADSTDGRAPATRPSSYSRNPTRQRPNLPGRQARSTRRTTAFTYDLTPHLRHTWLVRSDRGQP
ncbi:hypothetical protein O1M63_02705 [Streptomyces mirabilis]|nr:hypothetical protein [Streptomyces mirabilis]